MNTQINPTEAADLELPADVGHSHEAPVVEPPSNLTAKEHTDGWCVVDSAGGVWWPCEDAQIELEASNDPSARVLEMCHVGDVGGEWHN